MILMKTLKGSVLVVALVVVFVSWGNNAMAAPLYNGDSNSVGIGYISGTVYAHPPNIPSAIPFNGVNLKYSHFFYDFLALDLQFFTLNSSAGYNGTAYDVQLAYHLNFSETFGLYASIGGGGYTYQGRDPWGQAVSESSGYNTREIGLEMKISNNMVGHIGDKLISAGPDGLFGVSVEGLTIGLNYIF